MRTVEHTVDIAASPARVWQVLIETGAYPSWNPFMTRLAGPLTVGGRLTVALRLGARTMTFRPTLETVDGGTRFTQRERYLDSSQHRENPRMETS